MLSAAGTGVGEGCTSAEVPLAEPKEDWMVKASAERIKMKEKSVAKRAVRIIVKVYPLTRKKTKRSKLCSLPLSVIPGLTGNPDLDPRFRGDDRPLC